MNKPDGFHRSLTEWISDGPTDVADRVIDSALETIDHTPQRRRPLVPWRFPTMPFSNRLALVALLVLATVGTALVASTGISPSPEGPREIVVAQDGSGDVTTITEAVAMALDGDTILVRPGIYPESIAISSDITLRGDGDRGAVTIQFTADGPLHPLGFHYGILLDGSDAHVGNLTVRGPADVGDEPPISALLIDGGAPVLEGLDIVLAGDRWAYGSGSYYKRSAIQIRGGSSAVIRDSTWDGYTRMDGASNSPTFEGNVLTGQHIAVGPGGQEPVIRGNTFLDGAAIRWDSTGSGGIAEGNDIDGWIGVDESNDPTIRANRIRGGDVPDASSGYRGAAIKISSGASPIVEGNEITDSPYGIEVSGFSAKPEIRGNTVRGSSSVAVVIEKGAAPTVEGNVLERNGTAVEVDATSAAVISGNTLCDNATDLAIPEPNEATVEGNTICAGAASPAP